MSLNDLESPSLASEKQGMSPLSSEWVRENEGFVRSAPASAGATAANLADGAHPLAAYGAMKIAGPRAEDEDSGAWLWRGYLVRGGVTLLTSLWKTGKTTLLSVLLDRMREGGTLAGQPVSKSRVVILSEESPVQWRLRAGKLTFGDSSTFLCRPFRGKPRREDWSDLINQLIVLHQSEGLDLIVIDPLASFLPGRDENSAATMLETLTPLQRLTAVGVCVLLIHHPRKHLSPAGTIARGSGALNAFVDISLEMERFAPADDLDRRRRLRAYSRFEQTPRHAILELNEAGTDYMYHGDFAQVECRTGWERVQRFLETAPCKLSRDEIREDWPKDDHPVPGSTALWQWLEKAVAEGSLSREGAGTKNDPFLYWLPGKEVEWPDDPMWFLREEMAFDPVKEERERIRRERRERRRRVGGRIMEA